MSWLLGNTLVAAVLALATLAVGRWVRPAPAVMHGLWLVVLLKLVTPPLLQVEFGLPWATPSAEVVTVDLDGVVSPRASASSPVVPAARTPAQPAPATLPWTTVLLALWSLGGSLLLLHFAKGVVRAERRLRRLPAVPTALRAEVAALASQLRVDVPDLRDDPDAGSPYVSGLGRARMVLPAAALARSSTKGRAAVIAHELAHLRRGDHVVVHLELLLAVLLWWHPLFWFARGQRRQWAELACDAWAVASVPEASLDYATALVEAVARPDHAVAATAVLAVRPAARAAFERRLTMILNERVPCRAGRAWWLPFASLGLTLFAAPVVAQHEESEPVRIEIKVNGRDLGELSAQERQVLLRRLLQTEAPVAPERRSDAARIDETQDPPRAKAPRRQRVPQAEPGVGEQLRKALAQAREELLGDADLRELGITDEVTGLLDDLAAGKGMQGSLDKVIRAAMKGAGRLAIREIESDPDLQELGLTAGIRQLVTGLLEDEHNLELLSGLARQAAASALDQAKAEIRADADLRELGIAGDVEALVDGLLSGKGDFDASLERLIETAMRRAGELAEDEVRDAPAPKAGPKSEPKPKARKRAPQGAPVIR